MSRSPTGHTPSSATSEETAIDDRDAWLAGREGPPDAQRLPPHQPSCLGCGPDNPAGYHLAVYRAGDGVVAEHVFTEAHVGAPGLAHGGAVATVCDDLLGFLLYVIETAAVTRHLEVDYLKPVVLGERHRLHATVESRDARKLWLRCAGHGPDGTLRFAARGLFISVGFEHFLQGLPPDERARAEEVLAEQRRAERDATAW